MIVRCKKWKSLFLILVVGTTFSCGDKGNIKQISLEEIPKAATNFFERASPSLRMVAFKAADEVTRSNYVVGWQLFMGVANNPELTPGQKKFLASAVTVLGAKVNEMAQAGNHEARQALLTRGKGK